jgi:hypothetical protein
MKPGNFQKCCFGYRGALNRKVFLHCFVAKFFPVAALLLLKPNFRISAAFAILTLNLFPSSALLILTLNFHISAALPILAQNFRHTTHSPMLTPNFHLSSALTVITLKIQHNFCPLLHTQKHLPPTTFTLLNAQHSTSTVAYFYQKDERVLREPSEV